MYAVHVSRRTALARLLMMTLPRLAPPRPRSSTSLPRLKTTAMARATVIATT